MATLTPVQAKLTGAAVTMAAASVGGDKVGGDGDVALLVTNGDSTSTNVTIVVPGNTEFGQAEPDVVVAVGAGATKLIGPLVGALEDKTTDSLVSVSYSKVTSLTVAALKV